VITPLVSQFQQLSVVSDARRQRTSPAPRHTSLVHCRCRTNGTRFSGPTSAGAPAGDPVRRHSQQRLRIMAKGRGGAAKPQRSRGRGRGAGAGAKVGKRQRRGLLGALVEGSSEDEDYCPEGEAPAPTAMPRRRRPGPAAAAGRGGSGRTPSARGRRRGAAAAAAPAASNSDSGETLGARRRRLLQQQQQAEGPLPPAPGASAAEGLPPSVLGRIFQLACRPGALPTACRIARVCRAWRDALGTAPEAWRVMDVRGRHSAAVDTWLQQQSASGRWAMVGAASPGGRAALGCAFALLGGPSARGGKAGLLSSHLQWPLLANQLSPPRELMHEPLPCGPCNPT
jgi:hypothetical protein